ncbi:unnamed protein product, partial [Iphiclides podalirius]
MSCIGALTRVCPSVRLYKRAQTLRTVRSRDRMSRPINSKCVFEINIHGFGITLYAWRRTQTADARDQSADNLWDGSHRRIAFSSEQTALGASLARPHAPLPRSAHAKSPYRTQNAEQRAPQKPATEPRKKSDARKYTVRGSPHLYHFIPPLPGRWQCEQKRNGPRYAAHGSEIIRSRNKIKKRPRNKRSAGEIRLKGLSGDAVWPAVIV